MAAGIQNKLRTGNIIVIHLHSEKKVFVVKNTMKRGYFDQQCKNKSLTFSVLSENLQAHMNFG